MNEDLSKSEYINFYYGCYYMAAICYAVLLLLTSILEYAMYDMGELLNTYY